MARTGLQAGQAERRNRGGQVIELEAMPRVVFQQRGMIGVG